MPPVLWPTFRQNRHLLNDIPVIGAIAIQHWAQEKYGVKLMITIIRHTFGRHLNFNPHLHILVSASGLRESDTTWVPSLEFDSDALMTRWKDGIVTYLRGAQQMGALTSELTATNLKSLLTTQHEREWKIHISLLSSKEHFLKYAGRYVRRPPLAEYRIVRVTEKSFDSEQRIIEDDAKCQRHTR